MMPCHCRYHWSYRILSLHIKELVQVEQLMHSNTIFVDISRIDDSSKSQIPGTVVGVRQSIDAISHSRVTALVDLLWHNLQFRSLIL